MKFWASLAVISLINSASFSLPRADISGNIEFLGYTSNNTTDVSSFNDDKLNNAVARLSLGAQVDISSNTKFNALFIYARGWGTSPDFYPDTGLKYIQEANLHLKNILGLSATAGRQFYGEQGDIVLFFGKRNDNTLSYSSLDALRFDYNGKLLGKDYKANIIAAFSKENSYTDRENITLAGFSDKMYHNDSFALGGYAYYYRNKDTADIEELWIYGFRTNGFKKGFNYHFEAAFDGGESENSAKYKGYAALVKLERTAFNIPGGSLVFRGLLGYGSGDRYENGSTLLTPVSDKNFHGIFPDFRPGEIYGNSPISAVYGEQGGISNLTVYNGAMDYSPAFLDNSRVSFDYFQFRQNSRASEITGGNRNIGSEFDVAVNYLPVENIKIKLIAAKFFPAGLMKAYSGADAASKLSLYTSFSF